jgi:hypothetical protein
MNQMDLDTLLREHGGLGGLARELGQHDPNVTAFEPAANDNASPARLSLWREVLNTFSSRVSKNRLAGWLRQSVPNRPL